MKKTAVTACLLICSVVWSYSESEKEAVYIGVRECAKCHTGSSMGDQFAKWLHSKHSLAWATLKSPESYQIARISGILDEPQNSPICLGCHAPSALHEDWQRDPSHSISDGVQCEDCHGPGSEYAVKHIMQDAKLAMTKGLLMPKPEVCMNCHIEKGSHVAVVQSASFDVKQRQEEIKHPTPNRARMDAMVRPEQLKALENLVRKKQPLPVYPKGKSLVSEPQYKTPLAAAIRPFANELWVACEASNSVVLVNLQTLEKEDEIAVGINPSGLAFHPQGHLAFVSNRHDDTVSVIDADKRKIIRSLAVGDEPHGLISDAQGRFLYVLNTASEDISVFDLSNFKKIKTLSASRGPWAVALSPDQQTLLVTNVLSKLADFRAPFASELTAISTQSSQVEQRFELPGANLVLGADWHPSGEFALVTLNRTKSNIPMTRLMQGWTITNGLGILWKNSEIDQVLLDEPNLGFADATDVAITPKGQHALVSSATTNRIAVVDLRAMRKLIQGMSAEQRKNHLPNFLGAAPQIISKYIHTPHSPRGIVMDSKRQQAYVTNALDDSISVIDLNKMVITKNIDLGGAKEISQLRYGERLFHSADITFRRQFSCHSCHPDGHVDGITYDIEPDGIGFDPVDNRTLRGILDTAPFKWSGINPSLQRQCGPRLAVFFTRIAPFTPEQLTALDYYITTIPRPPNRYHPLGSEYTEAQRRGKVMFARKMTNDGQMIPEGKRCITCHNPPYYTDRQKHNVGTQYKLDRSKEFDTPHLNNIYDSAPYLHNGMAHSLEQIWTDFNPNDEHGVTNDMTKDQLNDLIEYLKTL